ncbi:potassium transporter Kup [Jatrophihabitans fulvus]
MNDDSGTAVESAKTAAEGPDHQDPAPNARGTASHPSARGAGVIGLAVGALGVVFGDIGTSPLYALKTVFQIDGGKIAPTEGDVYGVISLVFWSVTLIVSFKYVVFIMRADNDGEGGVMALAALVHGAVTGRRSLVAVALLLGVVGASLFYGDSVITPAISVLSAVEGLEIAEPGLADAVLPIGIAILAVLFVVQRFGTNLVGKAFGPIMIVWFLALAAMGLPEILREPEILGALSPHHIVGFVADHPYLTFIALGAVVLAITGAEALYADMGHFGRAPIRRAWFFVAFPCLMLNYLGQGALLLGNEKAVSNPFYLLAPSWARFPLVVLATAATVIASQAVISGAFSVTRQAVRLGYLPNLTVRHTSTRESGQIYLPAVNWLIFGSVLVLMLAFRSSDKLATAYGLAVTGTFLTTSALFLIVARTIWHWALWRLVALGFVLGVVEIAFFAANITKVAHGGWLPLVIAVVVITVMVTWQEGRRIVTKRRVEMEGPLQKFIDELHDTDMPRVPGAAVFPHPTKKTTPIALRQNVEFNKVLHETVILVTVTSLNVPYVPIEERLRIDPLVHADDGITHIDMRFGFQDDQDIPEMLRLAVGRTDELDFDPNLVTYFLSRLTIERGDAEGLSTWQKRLFIGLAHNAANPALNFELPIDRTIVMGAHLDL